MKPGSRRTFHFLLWSGMSGQASYDCGATWKHGRVVVVVDLSSV